MSKLSLETMIPLGVVISLLSASGYTGSLIYRVNTNSAIIEEVQKTLVDIRESIV